MSSNLPVNNFIEAQLLAFLLRVDLRYHEVKLLFTRLYIQRLLLRLAEYFREVIRYEATKEEVRVGDC